MRKPNEEVAFSLVFSDRAEASVAKAQDWLSRFSEDTAQRFTLTLNSELTNLCLRLAEGLPQRRDEEASVFFARRTYRLTIHTSRARRRSSSGVWLVYYELLDADGDGEADTVQVLMVRHGAARPLGEEFDEETEP